MATAVVKIKDWDLMEYAYGLNKKGGINTPGFRFSKQLESALPIDRIITVKDGKWITPEGLVYVITEYMVDTDWDNDLSLVTYKTLI